MKQHTRSKFALIVEFVNIITVKFMEVLSWYVQFILMDIVEIAALIAKQKKRATSVSVR